MAKANQIMGSGHNSSQPSGSLSNTQKLTLSHCRLVKEGGMSDPTKTEQRFNKLTVVSFCIYLHECRQGSGKGSLNLYQDL